MGTKDLALNEPTPRMLPFLGVGDALAFEGGGKEEKSGGWLMREEESMEGFMLLRRALDAGLRKPGLGGGG